jgi:flavin-dependent dehydrogenase
MEYDVIVVGARVAGAATAMLLARRGLSVLVLEQARFPSDTLSTHQIQLPGVACLARWGLLDKVIASNAPPAREAIFAPGSVRLAGRYPEFEGVDAVYSPRRFILDALLVDAARQAGAEVIEGFVVSGLIFDGERVVGVRGTEKGSAERTFRSRLVIGADGKHSKVAKWAGAAEYARRPTGSASFYTYLAGVPCPAGEMYAAPDHVAGYWPTNDGLTLAFVAVPTARFDEFRADLDARFLGLARQHLGDRAGSAKRVERFRASPDLPNVFRTPFGPGWALVGDAGLVMDPITGQGIGNAMRDAEALAEAVVSGPSGGDLTRQLKRFQKHRDRNRKQMYEMTSDISSFRTNPQGDALFETLSGNQVGIDRFLGVLTGTIAPNDFFSPVRLVTLLGFRPTMRLLRVREAA